MGWLNCRYNGPANPEGPVYSVPVKDNPPPERQVNWPLTSSKVINGNNSFSYCIQEIQSMFFPTVGKLFFESWFLKTHTRYITIICK